MSRTKSSLPQRPAGCYRLGKDNFRGFGRTQQFCTTLVNLFFLGDGDLAVITAKVCS